jgi:DNA repair protein RadD
MCGRGLRIHESKENCLILDFGENFGRFGTLDDVYVKRKSAGKVEAKPYRECPECHSVVHISARECLDCGFEFPITEREITHSQWAYSGAILASDQEEEEPQVITVDAVKYSRHCKSGSPDSLKVSYQCGLRFFNEWVCIEHEGFAKSAALRFIQGVGGTAKTIGECEFECDIWAIPKTITIKKDGKYTKILSKLY